MDHITYTLQELHELLGGSEKFRTRILDICQWETDYADAVYDVFTGEDLQNQVLNSFVFCFLPSVSTVKYPSIDPECESAIQDIVKEFQLRK